MTQPFTEALTWVPRSRALGATLGRAHDLARAQGHAAVTLEHLLQALIEDPDASGVLLACNIDLLSLNAAVAAEVQKQPSGVANQPAAAPALVTILEYAVAAARQSKRAEINGAIVLAAVVGEGKSDAARLLQGMGLKFADAVQALRRAAASRQAANGSAETTAPPTPHSETAPQVAPPAAPSALPPAEQSAKEPTPSANGHHAFDDDPVTTARRRVEAIRNGHAPPPPAASSQPSTAGPQAPPAAATPPPIPTQATEPPSTADWAPPPAAQPAASRPPRMPPPVPPIAPQPPRHTGAEAASAPPARVPWSEGAAEPGVAVDPPVAVAAPAAGPLGPPIEPARLIESFPERMRARTPVTVEVRIQRTAVLATAAAFRVGGDIVLTRALSVRLRAPAGGFHVETAAPETQWFDARGPQRADDEVRWRWLVTPHRAGRHPLQLTIAMRTVAADGMMIETMLPEHQTTIRVASDYRAQARTWGALAAGGLAGAILALLASGQWVAVLGRLLG